MKKRDEFDIIDVDLWQAPTVDDDPVKILTMPNIPKPLHSLAPRTIEPDRWKYIRKACLVHCNYKCEVCGREMLKGLHGHELYSTDYMRQKAMFERCVGLCPMHHIGPGVHTGRAITLFKKHDKQMSKGRLLAGVEDIFKRISDYNQRKSPKEQDLRLFHVYLEYLDVPQIAEDMRRLIGTYDIKFYRPCVPEETNWDNWALIYKGKAYQSNFKDVQDWQKQMDVVDFAGVNEFDEKAYNAVDEDFLKSLLA